MGENCIGSQSPQRTVVLEKKKKKKMFRSDKFALIGEPGQREILKYNKVEGIRQIRHKKLHNTSVSTNAMRPTLLAGGLRY
jgi:hypothetical protein